MLRRAHIEGRGLLGRAALENENIVPAAGEEAGAGAENLETELLEITDAGDEVAADEQDVADAEEARQALEGMIVVLESAVEAGGLDRHGAAMMNIGLDFVGSKLGAPLAMRCGPSLESYGGAGTRISASSYALEDMKSKAREIFTRIIEAIKAGIKKITDFFFKVFGGYENLLKRAKALKQRAAATTGAKENDKFESEGTFKGLHVGGSVSATVGADLYKVMAPFFEKYAQGSKAVDSALEATINAAASGDFGKVGEAANGVGTGFISTANTFGLKKADAATTGHENIEGLDFYISSPFPGDTAVIGYTASAVTKDNVGKIGFKFAKANNKASDPTKFEFTTLEANKAEAQIDEVIKLAEMLVGFRKNVEDMGKVKTSITSALAKVDGSKVEDGDKDNFELLKALVSSITSKVDQPYVALAQYGLTAGKYVLDYAELSLKNHKKA